MVTMLLFVVLQCFEAVLVDFLYEKRKAQSEARSKVNWKEETLDHLWPQKRKRDFLYDIVSIPSEANKVEPFN